MALDLTSLTSPATATHLADETLSDGTPAVVEHDQRIVNSETRLAGELGIARWLAADVVLPFRVFDTHIHYLDPSTGHSVEIENGSIHHRNEVRVGPADPWLVARAAAVVAGFTLTARVGATIPIGSTVPNPFLLGDMGLPHEHTQFGTGTFEPVLGAEAYRTFGQLTIDGYWLTLQSLYANGYGYKPGNRYAFGASAASSFGTSSWRFRATLDRTSETAESWSGIVYTTEGNIGRVDVLAGLEAAYRINDDWRAALAIKVPVYTHVIGGQADTPLFASLTISTAVHVWKPKPARLRAVAEPRVDWTGLDEREVGPAGDAAPLVPVPGRLTAYDFWADWCKPCNELDHELAEVARRHPNDLAVRKINVIDNETRAWRTYLAPGGFDLPHVKLFDRDGKLVWERSGAPPMLAAGVEDAIAGAHVEPERPDAPESPTSQPESPAPPQPAQATPAKPLRVAITVIDSGYAPARVVVPHGRAVVLVFTRKSEKTCAVDVHLKLPDGTKIDRRLPLGQPVEIPLHVDKPVEIPYACGMDMNHGTIVVQ